MHLPQHDATPTLVHFGKCNSRQRRHGRPALSLLCTEYLVSSYIQDISNPDHIDVSLGINLSPGSSESLRHVIEVLV